MCSGGGGTTTTVNQPSIPPELKALITGTSDIFQNMQGSGAQPGPAMNWLSNYINSQLTDPNSRALQVSPLSGLQQQVYNTAQAGLTDAAQVSTGIDMASLFLSPYLSGAGVPGLGGQGIGQVSMQALIDAINKGGQFADMTVQTPSATGQIDPILQQALAASSQQIGINPQQQAAQAALGQLPGVAATPLTTPPAETQALSLLNSLTGGPVGSSPATQQAIDFLEQQYQTRSLPALQNQLAMAGLGRSGALEQGVTDLRGQLFGAEVPLLQQEISNRAAATQALAGISGQQLSAQEFPIQQQLAALQSQAGGYAGLGSQLAGQQLSGQQLQAGTALSAANPYLALAQFQNQLGLQPIQQQIGYQQSLFPTLMQGTQIPLSAAPIENQIYQNQLAMGQFAGQAGALPQDQLNQVLQAQYQQDLRNQAMSEQFISGPLGITPSSIGSQVTSKTSGGGMFGK